MLRSENSMKLKKAMILLLIAFPRSQISYADSAPILGGQPVIEIAYTADGKISEIHTMKVESDHDGERIRYGHGVDVIDPDPANRPTQRHVEAGPEQLSQSEIALELEEGDSRRGISRRVLLIPRLDDSKEKLWAYIAYNPNAGYVQAVDQTWVVRDPEGKALYVVVGYQGPAHSRQYEVIQGPGIKRTIVPVPVGRDLAEEAAKRGYYFVSSQRPLSRERRMAGDFRAASSAGIPGRLIQEAEQRSAFLRAREGSANCIIRALERIVNLSS